MSVIDTLTSKSLNKMQEWQNSLPLFVDECLGAKPTNQQVGALKDFQNTKMMSIRSGHGTGKDTFASWVILWYLTTKLYPKVPCTAPTGHQLRDVLWAEIYKWLRQSKVKDEFTWNNERIYLKAAKEEWFAVARSVNVRGSSEEQAETLAGLHADNMLFVVDESSGVPDPVYKPIEGALTTKGNQVLLIGNMTKREGYFHETHYNPALAKFWKRLHWDSRDSSRVSDEWVDYMREKYGEDSNVFRIRVMGEPPLSDENYQSVIPYDWAMACMDNDIGEPAKDEPKYIGVDVARFGDDSSVILPRTGLLIHPFHKFKGMNTIELGGYVNHIYNEEEARGIAIDEIGVGAGVTDWLMKHHDRGVVHGVNVSNSANDPERFHRLRDELWWTVREKCMKQSYSFPPGAQGQELVDDLAAPTYEIVESKIKVEGKKKMKARNVASPDVAEALLMTEYFGLNASRKWPTAPREDYQSEDYSYNDPFAWMVV